MVKNRQKFQKNLFNFYSALDPILSNSKNCRKHANHSSQFSRLHVSASSHVSTHKKLKMHI
jgi:hypothetical protein